MVRRDKKTKEPSPKPTLDDLLAAASSVRQKAYAPYSRFNVGAALRTTTGQIMVGCNVENASYGLTLCAERAAIARAVADGASSFDALAIVTESSPPAPPCGQCLQSLAEFADDLDIVVANESGECLRIRLRQLLPFRFKPEMLANSPKR